MLTVKTDRLSKYYGQDLGVRDISLEIEEGEIFGFIGPNGAGKSTTIRTLLGLLIPSSGSAQIFGKDIRKFGPAIRKRIGYLPSEVNYYEEMTSRELLEYHCRFYDIYNYTDIDRYADRFELDLDKQITDLSFGNRKKCGIIQAFVHQPDLLVMDEPTSGLDPLMQNIFFEMLQAENKKGTTIFFSSHILSEVQNVCHRAAIIKNGEIIATENIQTLLKKQMKKVTLSFKQKPERLEYLIGSQNQTWRDDVLTFEYVGPIDTLIRWISNFTLHDVILEEPDLESIFINYYENENE